MGPKKEVKNAVEEPPKDVEPEPQPHELVGYGRFEYLNGVIYEGNWKLIKGIKVKHGYGRLILPQQQLTEEYYQGNWEEDKMQGLGTYHYPDGSTYSGEWVGGQHHGRGRFSFANGTSYDGMWRDHQMHGSGYYVDHLGRKWEGQFREGVFESRKQMELSKEKVLHDRREQTKQEIKTTVSHILEALEKQVIGDQLGRFFAHSQHVKSLISGELLKQSSKTKEEWKQVLRLAQGGEVVLLQRRAECKTIPSERLLVRQQQGQGQVAEVFFSKAGKKVSLLFLQLQKGRWIAAAINEELP